MTEGIDGGFLHSSNSFLVMIGYKRSKPASTKRIGQEVTAGRVVYIFVLRGGCTNGN